MINMRNFLFAIIFLFLFLNISNSLREFRSYSIRTACENVQDPNYPFAYSKYNTQLIEAKGRVNSNKQDFRHQCQVLGGKSKCSICEEIQCNSTYGICQLQLQGVNTSEMSLNIPTVSDTSWAVNGNFRHDYGSANISHFCVFLTGGSCINPYNTDFSGCVTRCFGHGFHKPPIKNIALSRSVIDLYPGMKRWADDGQVDLWEMPKNCSELKSYQNLSCDFSGPLNKTPNFNPQGYVFTFSGSGEKGLLDGMPHLAKFNSPEDVAVDEAGYVFVADTKNHAIRMVYPNGTVFTIAGKGTLYPGYQDGNCSVATFSNPKGLDVRTMVLNQKNISMVLIADTGNHRIRKIMFNKQTFECNVTCLTGLCGNNTLSETDSTSRATPLTGFADGNGLEARFSAPESVAFLDGNYFVVADSGNFLIRFVDIYTGNTSTLAGSIIPGQTDADGKPLPGCTPPCMVGQQGYRDGNLTFAQFYNPIDVTRGPNNTIWVTDEQRIRIIELPSVITQYFGILSEGRVSTLAGTSLQGHDDGIADKSNFFYSSGAFVDPDGIAYVVDSISCHIRRITPFPLVSEPADCKSTIIKFIRPSGCTSYDMSIDKTGRKISRVEGNVQYNYGFPYTDDINRGKYIKNCVGVPPRDKLDKRFVNITGDNLVIDDLRTSVIEDSEEGMAILISCPSFCKNETYDQKVEGTTWYSEESSVCLAAIHDGKIDSLGGIILVVLARLDYLNSFSNSFKNGSFQNGIQSSQIPQNISRVFRFEKYNISNNMVHTIAGSPSADLQSVCGFYDGQPATQSLFNKPAGIAAKYGTKITDSHYLYVADSANHRIRAISAVCTFICENGGRCVGNDQCICPFGWSGIDCTIPICNYTCGLNSLCVAPNICACKPGYSGLNCDQPLCQQTCYNGGFCAAPDTCKCPSGWFDSNCTTPVCDITCANGGNCTAPNTCACPSQWSGKDCRTPVCIQDCKNNGYCVAPNTCACSPQWTNYDCSAPVCHQGYFETYSGSSQNYFSVSIPSYPTYKNCDLERWCNYTNEFECDQTSYNYEVIRVPSGPESRSITGRKVSPTRCMKIELPIDFKIPYQLVYADNTTTGYVRYSPFSPYESNDKNYWRGYLTPTEGHTGPWVYQADRQIANVDWLNVSQGRYVCANNGSCVAPEVCSCSEGWSGFDCRTPICTQGYYKANQTTYVSGLETATEIEIFEPYLGNNTYRLRWPYSNPNFSVQFEFYINQSYIQREYKLSQGKRYLGPVSYFPNGTFIPTYQGGFRCSIRADTIWENEYFVFEHPNFFSQYMDKVVQGDGNIYTYWQNFSWPPTHHKSRILDQTSFNLSFAFSNEGYRRKGIWNLTGNPWEFGVCILQFQRNCSTSSEELDLESELYGVLVQDTDLSYRPRITYNDKKVISFGRWKQSLGNCVDQVVRGCPNNGTCVAPDTCSCASGWKGNDCRTPICNQTCYHNGNCTSPNICTCEKGWSGSDCSIPLCAQECQNGGTCVAPDTCQCFQFDNDFRDGRIAGGRPLFRDENGDPLKTGWTGYDCSVPICVQSEKFVLNVASSGSSGYVEMGGHGADALLDCTDSSTGATLPRCPQYDNYVTGNDGKSFQTGCGWDPFDTGCCIEGDNNAISCYKCDSSIIVATNHSFYCNGDYTILQGVTTEKDKFSEFLDDNRNFLICGQYHSPRDHEEDVTPQDYGVAKYYVDVLNSEQSSYNYRSNLTSNRFLCNVFNWTQGDYIDDAGLSEITGAGSVYGLFKGRHIRINTPNIIIDSVAQTYTRGAILYGEGVYECYNSGSCISPDICTCTDGYDGYDCNTPLCRHLQPSGVVSSCLNGGVCISKDSCTCIQTTSVLYLVHPEASKGITGWTGTDCSMPMCSQGYYDPFCTDLDQAPGGEGCYRCSNGGNCTAPDVCTCADGWTGYDCKTPVCETVADPLTRTQLGSVYEDKIISFESDPCGVQSIYGVHGWKGRKYTRGNCTQPNQCTCLCKIPYDKRACRKSGRHCRGPWQDNLVKVRNLLVNRGPQFTFGSTDCRFGFEGNVDSMDRFTTCHQTIYYPSSTESSSLVLIVCFSVFGFFAIIFYRFASVRLKRKFLLAKIERRKTKRSSEESILSAGSGSFLTK